MNPLTEAEIHVLNEALDDEYFAWATYDQVITDFGEVPPFSNIREAEARHIEALCTLFARYGLPVPENPWPGKVARYASLQAACEAGVAAEIANGEMYERLLGATQRPDILIVLRNLQEASQQRHLAAFQRCAQRSAGGGGGRHMHGRGRS
nr:L412 [uncultured bacterium]